MNCPACKDTVLSMSERNGIEIDYCPNCRGVWLDRGELDKILEKSSSEKEPASTQREKIQEVIYRDSHKDSHHKDSNYNYKQKRKKSFLEELFD